MCVQTTTTDSADSFQSYKSPTEMFKGRLLSLLFECITHHSKALKDENEIYAFARKSWDLSILLEKFIPSSKRKELMNWYKQLKVDIQKVRDQKKNKKDDSITPKEIENQILNLEFSYAEEVHNHNTRIIINSPILEVEVEGDLDVTDINIVDIVRLKKREDDGKLCFKK